RDNYKVRSVTLAPKPPAGGAGGLAPGGVATIGQAPAGTIEIPKDCTAVIVAGPKNGYPAPVVTALKTFVEGGGRVLFLIDTPISIGRDQAQDSPELVAQLTTWGVTPQKNLVLDLSGRGSILGLGPEIALVGSYESHLIVRDLKNVGTAFPL